MGETGLSPETMRRAAADPAFLACVLEYLIKNETILIEFASELGLEPMQVATAHARLTPAG